MRKPNDMSRCLAAFKQVSTLVAVIELDLKSCLVAGIVPGIERQPLKKLKPNEGALLACFTVGARRQGRPAIRLSASALPSRPPATASGWRAGSAAARSRLT
jgi:transposase